MAGDKHHTMGVFPVRQRHAQRRHGRQASGDAVDYAHSDAGSPKMSRFFAATAKDEGVAALKSHHLLTVLHCTDHQFFNEGLRC